MYDIRFHGRGGQGAVICANMLAAALAAEGGYALSFPRFSGDRRGGPVTAFVRLSKNEREVPRCQIYEPDGLILMHPTILGVAGAPAASEVFEGFKPGGLVLINTPRSPQEIELPVAATIATVNATRIAERHGLGTATARPVNTALLGALVRVTEIVAMASLEAAIRAEVPEKIEANLAAAREAYASVVAHRQEVAHA
jgi:pyruvate ferredoxin oxidoreductase gamma subunit/2-oxoisovalerate ferredoxin oxidoreductase gamma subunit